jgi:hypothetical protein
VVQANPTGTGGSTQDSFDLGVFAIGTVNQGHNIDMNFGVTGQDADGDTSTGTIDVTLTAVPIQPLSVQTAQVVSQTSLNTSSLVGTNDNHHEQRAAESGHNSVMMGALAAAGLSALDASHGNHVSFRDFGQGELDHQAFHTASLGSVTTESASVAQTSHVLQSAVVSKAPVEPQHNGTVHDMVDTVHSLTAASTNNAHGNTELLHGTTVPVQGASGGHAATAASVVMPSAQQLAAVHGNHSGNSVAGAQHDEVVGKVLADALHGGEGHGPNVDMLLSAMSTHGAGAGGNAGLEALASQAAGGVSFMHMGGAGGSGGFHMPLMVEMVTHADVAPPAHG